MSCINQLAFKNNYASPACAINTDSSGNLNLIPASSANVTIVDPTNNYNIAIGNICANKIAGGGTNIAIGNSCCKQLSTGSSNLIMGSNTGNNLTTGSSNVILGEDISAITTGSSNVVIGSGGSGAFMTTAINNVVIGNNSASGLSTGEYNVSIGQESGSIGNYNTAVGPQALGCEGNNNTCLGYQAGFDFNNTMNNSTCIGYGSGPSSSDETTTYSNLTLIGAGAVPSIVGVNNQVVIGNSTSNTFFGGNMCIPSVYDGSSEPPTTAYLGQMILLVPVVESVPTPYLYINYSDNYNSPLWAAVNLTIS